MNASVSTACTLFPDDAASLSGNHRKNAMWTPERKKQAIFITIGVVIGVAAAMYIPMGIPAAWDPPAIGAAVGAGLGGLAYMILGKRNG